MVGVRENSNNPSRSLTLNAPNTSTGTRTPARRNTMPSSISAHASIVAPACSRASATRSEPCPYALAFTTAIIPGGVVVPRRNSWIARKLLFRASRSTRATVLRTIAMSQVASRKSQVTCRWQVMGRSPYLQRPTGDLSLSTGALREIGESRLFTEERQAHNPGRPVPLLRDNQLCDPGVGTVRILVVHIVTIDQADDVGVLLERSRFAQV